MPGTYLIDNNLKPHDFSGTLRDLQGNPVPKPGGGYYDHKQEMDNSHTGLKAVKKSLENSLKNPNLNPEAKNVLQDALKETNYYIDKIEDLYSQNDKSDDNDKGTGGGSGGGGYKPGTVYNEPDDAPFMVDKNGNKQYIPFTIDESGRPVPMFVGPSNPGSVKVPSIKMPNLFRAPIPVF